MDNLISRKVTQLVNEVGDEIELEIFRYDKHYDVTATICPDKPPFKDYIAFGTHNRRRKSAIRNALKELYLEAYDK